MAEQPTTSAPKTDADAALRLLDEAWAYYTPSREPVMPGDQYTDLPTAA
jgi:hypothetical protein